MRLLHWIILCGTLQLCSRVDAQTSDKDRDRDEFLGITIFQLLLILGEIGIGAGVFILICFLICNVCRRSRSRPGNRPVELNHYSTGPSAPFFVPSSSEATGDAAPAASVLNPHEPRTTTDTKSKSENIYHTVTPLLPPNYEDAISEGNIKDKEETGL